MMKKFALLLSIISGILTVLLWVSVYSAGYKTGRIVPALVLLSALVFVLILFSIKKSGSKAGKVFSAILLVADILIAAAYLEFSVILSHIKNMTITNVEMSSVSVYVLKDTGEESVANLTNGIFVIHADADREHVDQTIRELEEELNGELEILETENWDEVVNALYTNEADAAIMNDAYAAILDDEQFISKTKVLSTSVITHEKEDISKDVNVTNTPFNVYISGIDTYGNISIKSRSDVNMIVTVDPVNKKILLTSIPRDYYVNLGCETTGALDKLTHSGIYGINCTVKTIENLFDIDINYYVRVNFSSVVKVIDLLGDIEVWSDYSIKTSNGVYVSKGLNTMDSATALAFARERYAYASGDRQRIKNQQAVLSGIIQKVISPSVIVKANSLLEAAGSSIEMNFTVEEVNSLINMQLNDMADWEILMQSVDGVGETNTTYSMGSNTYCYVMRPDMETVQAAKDKIDEICNYK